MSVNIKQNGELVKIANNISIVQADWNDRENTNKNTSIKNQPDTIKTMADLIECQDANALAGAMAVVEALDYQKVGNLYELICDSLDSFVKSTATNIETPSIGRFNDPQKSWTPDGNVTHSWYRFIITYQNPYVTGSLLNIYGNGIFWHDDGRMWNVLISGNKDEGLSVKYDLVNKPTITTRQDLMANTVSGLFPDALAVKDAINGIRTCKFSGKSYATLEEFVMDMASSAELYSEETFKAGIFKDTGKWGPKGVSGNWYHFMVTSQNAYTEEQQYDTTVNGIFTDGLGSFWTVFIYGKKDTGLTTTYTDLSVTKDLSKRVVDYAAKPVITASVYVRASKAVDFSITHETSNEPVSIYIVCGATNSTEQSQISLITGVFTGTTGQKPTAFTVTSNTTLSGNPFVAEVVGYDTSNCTVILRIKNFQRATLVPMFQITLPRTNSKINSITSPDSI